MSFTPEFKDKNSDEFKEFQDDNDSHDPDYDEQYHSLIYTKF